MTGFAAAIEETIGAGRLQANVALAPFTTFRVGGPAEWLLETHSSDELVSVLKVARDFGVPATILGGGSNVLIADRGIRGLVVRARRGAIEIGRASCRERV